MWPHGPDAHVPALVRVRLIDSPLHEFLPPLEEMTARVARADALGEKPGHDVTLLAAVRRMHEANPMLGLPGVRPGLVIPGLFERHRSGSAR